MKLKELLERSKHRYITIVQNNKHNEGITYICVKSLIWKPLLEELEAYLDYEVMNIAPEYYYEANEEVFMYLYVEIKN